MLRMGGKGKDLEALEEKHKGVVWKGEAWGVLGFCLSPKKELRVWSKQSPRAVTLQPKGYTATCHHKWHIADVSNNSSTVYTVHYICIWDMWSYLLCRSCVFWCPFAAHPVTFLCFCYSWGRGFIQAICSGGGMLTVTHQHTHIHELVFSLCPYALCGVLLLLCCSQTGLFSAAWQQGRSSQPPPN